MTVGAGLVIFISAQAARRQDDGASPFVDGQALRTRAADESLDHRLLAPGPLGMREAISASLFKNLTGLPMSQKLGQVESSDQFMNKTF